jgi:hypothetical protein
LWQAGLFELETGNRKQETGRDPDPSVLCSLFPVSGEALKTVEAPFRTPRRLREERVLLAGGI